MHTGSSAPSAERWAHARIIDGRLEQLLPVRHQRVCRRQSYPAGPTSARRPRNAVLSETVGRPISVRCFSGSEAPNPKEAWKEDWPCIITYMVGLGSFERGSDDAGYAFVGKHGVG